MPSSIGTEKDLTELDDVDVTASINRYSIFNLSLKSFESSNEETTNEERTNDKHDCLRKFRKYKSTIGLTLAFFSSFFAALAGILIRVLSFSMSPAEIFTMRSAVQTMIMTPLVISKRSELTLQRLELFLLTLLCFFDTAGSLCTHYAFSLIPVAEAAIIINFRNIFTLPMAKFWLKESVGIYELIVVIISIGGLIMTCQPPVIFGGAATAFTTARLFGIICSLSSAAFNSVSKCINRKLQDLHLHFILFFPALLSTFVGGIFLLVENSAQNPFTVKNSYVMIVIIIIGILSNTCQSSASQLAMAMSVAIIMALRMPFSVLLEFLIIGTWPNIFTTIGLILAVISILLLAMKTTIMQRLYPKPSEYEDITE